MLLPNQDSGFSAQLAEKIRAKVMAIRIKHKKSGEVISSVTASFGVATLAQGETPEGLISRADAALYQAKKNGRNNVQTG